MQEDIESFEAAQELMTKRDLAACHQSAPRAPGICWPLIFIIYMSLILIIYMSSLYCLEYSYLHAMNRDED